MSAALSHSFPMPNGQFLNIETKTGEGVSQVSARVETPEQYARRKADEHYEAALACDRQMADVGRFHG